MLLKPITYTAVSALLLLSTPAFSADQATVDKAVKASGSVGGLGIGSGAGLGAGATAQDNGAIGGGATASGNTNPPAAAIEAEAGIVGQANDPSLNTPISQEGSVSSGVTPNVSGTPLDNSEAVTTNSGSSITPSGALETDAGILGQTGRTPNPGIDGRSEGSAGTRIPTGSETSAPISPSFGTSSRASATTGNDRASPSQGGATRAGAAGATSGGGTGTAGSSVGGSAGGSASSGGGAGGGGQ